VSFGWLVFAVVLVALFLGLQLIRRSRRVR